jgi:hypothetical protein
MSFKDLSSSDTAVEAAKAEHVALLASLRAKQKTVTGEFTPQTAGLALLTDGAMLRGGPFDGIECKVPRGAGHYDRPTADPAGLAFFVPARYSRTGKRDESGLAVFQYQEAVSATV